MNRTKTISGVRLMTEVGNGYYSFGSNIYKSDIVRSCIRPRANQISKLVAKHIREYMDAEGQKKIDVNPTFYIKMLLEEPNPLMSMPVMLMKLGTHLCLNRNAFVLIVRNADGLPIELYPILASRVEAVYPNNGELHLKFLMKNGRTYTFPYSDVIHIREDFNENDVFGTPIHDALMPMCEVVSVSDQGLINAIKNSSVIKWLLKFSNSLRPEHLRDQAKEFADNYLKTDAGLGVAAVDSKADAIQIKPTDYVPNSPVMKATEDRIMKLMNTNEKIVKSMANEEERNAYFDAEIEPVENQLNFEFTRKIFSRNQRSYGNRIVFEASAWDNASFQTKLNLVQMVDRGAMLPNEWREAFNLAPISGGDEPIRRLDTAVVKEGEN